MRAAVFIAICVPMILLHVVCIAHPSTVALAAAGGRATKATVLYKADFKKSKLRGWSGGNDPWKVSNGTVKYDGKVPSALSAPRVTGERDFAVEATIASEGSRGPSNAYHAYGIFVRKTTAPHSGVFGLSYFAPQPHLTGPQLSFNLDSIGGSNIQPHSGYNKYRLVVHGTDYTLFINNKRAVHINVPLYSDGTRVGVDSNYYAIKVRFFRIIRLPKVDTPVKPLPVEKTANLTVTDLSSMVQVYGHYFTNKEISRLDNVALKTVRGWGRLLSYDAQFVPAQSTGGPGIAGIDSNITTYSSGDMAHGGYTRQLTLTRNTVGQMPAYKATPVNNYGDEATIVKYEQNGNGHAIFIVRQGSHVVLMRYDFSGAITQSEATAASELGARVIRRLKAS